MRALFERNRFLFTFALLSSLMGISVGLAKVTTSLYALELGANEALVGMIAASQSVGVLLMSLPLGFMVDRHGPSRLFVIGSLTAGLLYALIPLLPSAGFLLLCTTAISFFMPFRFVSLNTVFLEQLAALGEDKAGWYRGSHVAGMFLIGPMLAASTLHALDFAGTYWLIALAFLFSVLLSPLVFRVHPERPRSSRALGLAEIRSQLGLIARDPELRGACMAEFTAQAINNYYAVFIVVIAVNSLRLGLSEATSLVAAQGLWYVFALLALGRVASRLGPLVVYLVSCAVLSAGLLVLALGQIAALLWAGGMLLGLGLGLLQIVNLTRFARVGARVGRGKVAGLNALTGPAGGLVGSFGGGVIGAQVGLRSVFLLFVPALALLYWQLSLKRADVTVEA